jgi:TolB-like protein
MRRSETGELSRREREIALAYSEGASYRDIGARLFISPATVRTHLGTIYRKLGVSSKIELLHAMTASEPTPPVFAPGAARWTSLAVMPFRPRGAPPEEVADGVVYDIISRLVRLRSVRVTARGSVFALAERGLSDEEAARLLGVDYLVTGTLRRHGERIALGVELVDMSDGRVQWADSYDCAGEDVFDARDEICDRIVATLAGEIEAAERNRAVLAHPDSLGAWECFHRGLWHMYRFTRADNGEAQALFRRSVEMDPTFSRAWAGLSFTHFQNAFLHHSEDRDREIGRAFDTAGRSLQADERDPTAHWAMGRALWLRRSGDQALHELRTAVGLAPNFGPGHYALAFVGSQSGEPEVAIAAANHARSLSPFDPLLFGILASQAIAMFRAGSFEDAAEAATRAAERPNSHHHIWMVAALCLAAAERPNDALQFTARIRRTHPAYGFEDFRVAFRLAPDTEVQFRYLAERIGIG